MGTTWKHGYNPYTGEIDGPMSVEQIAEIAAAELAALKTQNTKLRDALLLLEWSVAGEYIDSAKSCPECEAAKADGHRDECYLGAALGQGE